MLLTWPKSSLAYIDDSNSGSVATSSFFVNSYQLMPSIRLEFVYGLVDAQQMNWGQYNVTKMLYITSDTIQRS